MSSMRRTLLRRINRTPVERYGVGNRSSRRRKVKKEEK